LRIALANQIISAAHREGIQWQQRGARQQGDADCCLPERFLAHFGFWLPSDLLSGVRFRAQ
jgi:hypothetical protein